jgi:hypothetical protein
MFNQFAKYEDAFRDWRRDGMPGLKPEFYGYVEFRTSKDDDQLPRDGALWPHQWEAFLRVVHPHDCSGQLVARASRCVWWVLGAATGRDRPVRADRHHRAGESRRD